MYSCDCRPGFNRTVYAVESLGRVYPRKCVQQHHLLRDARMLREVAFQRPGRPLKVAARSDER